MPVKIVSVKSPTDQRKTVPWPASAYKFCLNAHLYFARRDPPAYSKRTTTSDPYRRYPENAIRFHSCPPPSRYETLYTAFVGSQNVRLSAVCDPKLTDQFTPAIPVCCGTSVAMRSTRRISPVAGDAHTCPRNGRR